MLSLKRKQEHVVPTTAVFPEIDISGLSRNLKLEVRAREDGKHELPKTKATVFDAVEMEIINEVGRVRREGLNRYSRAMESYTRRIESTPTEEESAKALAREVETNYLTISRERSNALVTYQEDMDVRLEEYQGFRKYHRRRSTPKEKDTWFKFCSVVGAVAVVETGINGNFFATNNAQGLLGGISIAVGITLINLLASYSLGRFTTWKNHIKIPTRIIGYLVGLVYVIFFGMFSLAVGHYRESYKSLSPALAPEAALNSLLQRPFELGGLDSWALVLITAMISLFMFWKSYMRDDPYPGYYDVWDRMRSARDEYAHEVKDAHDELLEARDKALDRLQFQREDFKATVDDSRSALAAQSRMPDQLQTFLNALDQATRQLLAIYRQENSKHRKTDPPAYFQQEFQHPVETPHVGEAPRGTIDARAIERVNAAYDSTINSISDQYESSVRGFETIVANHKGLA